MKVWLPAVTATAALATAAAVAAFGQQGGTGEQMELAHGERHGDSVRFTLDGRPLHGLHPGATRRIRITVANPFGFPLSLRSVTGRLVATSRPACPATAASLRLGAYDGRLPVGVRARTRTALPGSLTVTMPRTAPPACAGTRFMIALTGAGTRAGR